MMQEADRFHGRWSAGRAGRASATSRHKQATLHLAGGRDPVVLGLQALLIGLTGEAFGLARSLRRSDPAREFQPSSIAGGLRRRQPRLAAAPDGLAMGGGDRAALERPAAEQFVRHLVENRAPERALISPQPSDPGLPARDLSELPRRRRRRRDDRSSVRRAPPEKPAPNLGAVGEIGRNDALRTRIVRGASGLHLRRKMRPQPSRPPGGHGYLEIGRGFAQASVNSLARRRRNRPRAGRFRHAEYGRGL